MQDSTITEIRDTPRALAQVLNKTTILKRIVHSLLEKKIKHLFLIGCGSSYYAALTGAYSAVNLPLDVRAVPASELLFYYARTLSKDDSAIVALSRSGKTAETLATLKEARMRGIETIALVCSQDSPLAEEAQHNVVLNIGEEQSIVMTKSFSSLSFASILLFGEFAKSMDIDLGNEWKPDQVPGAALEALKLEVDVTHVAHRLTTKRTSIFLGEGSAYPVALEGALKLMETSYVVSSAMPSLEFRHGPVAAADKDVGLVVSAFKGPSSQALVKLVEDLREYGLDPIIFSNITEIGDSIRIPWAFDERLAPTIAIIPLQLLAHQTCVQKGFDPDKPRRLTKFVGRF